MTKVKRSQVMFERKRSFEIIAPATGRCAPIAREDNSPPVSGVVIEPERGEIYAPVTGVLTYSVPLNSTFSIATDDGFSVKVNVGVGSADQDNRGYTRMVRSQERVTVGEKILVADLELLKNRSRPTLTSVTLEGNDRIERVELYEGAVEAGESPIMSVLYGEGGEPRLKRTEKPRRTAGL